MATCFTLVTADHLGSHKYFLITLREWKQWYFYFLDKNKWGLIISILLFLMFMSTCLTHAVRKVSFQFLFFFLSFWIGISLFLQLCTKFPKQPLRIKANLRSCKGQMCKEETKIYLLLLMMSKVRPGSTFLKVFKHLTNQPIWEGQLLQNYTKFFDHL